MCVFTQGDLAHKIFIVKTGQFELVRTTKFKELECEIQGNRNYLGPGFNTKQRQLIKTNKQQKKQKIQNRLCIVNQGEAIGIVDVIEARKHTSSMICTSGHGVCYVA